MVWVALAMLLIGLALSAFFSGTETGFYRANRVRMVMDALEGDRTAKRLLFFANHPPLFVATTLVGNNSANYLTSLAIVLGTNAVVGNEAAMELLASICFAPAIFVYGELLPKSLYFQAPNRLLHQGSWFFRICAILFAPISAVLWALGRLLEIVLGQSPTKIRAALAKKELGEVLIEGQDAGILHSTQLNLAQNFFLNASKEIRDATTPLSKLPTIPSHIDVPTALRIAKNSRLTEIAVIDETANELIGYVRTIELLVDSQRKSLAGTICPLVEIHQSTSFGVAIMRLQAARELMARVINDDDQTVGVITTDDLTSPLLSGPLISLRR